MISIQTRNDEYLAIDEKRIIIVSDGQRAESMKNRLLSLLYGEDENFVFVHFMI